MKNKTKNQPTLWIALTEEEGIGGLCSSIRSLSMFSGVLSLDLELEYGGG